MRLNFNKTGVSNLYKFMAVLKSEIYTNNFFLQKIFKSRFKRVSLLIANCLTNLFQKLNKKLKKLHSENLKRTFFYVNVKTIFGLHLPFAINFMFELNKLFKKSLV